MLRVHLLAVCLLALALGVGCSSGPETQGDEDPASEAPDTDVLDSSLQQLSSELATAIADAGKEEPRVVVYYFSFGGEQQTALGQYVAATLPVYIKKHGPGTVKVYTRRKLEQARDELSLQSQALFDETTTAQVGKMVGANLMVSGDIFDRASTYEFNASVVDVETGELIGSHRVKCARTDDVAALAGAVGTNEVEPESAAEQASYETASIPVEEEPETSGAFVEEGSEAEVQVQKAQFYVDRGQSETALKYYEKAAGDKKLGAAAMIHFAQALLKRGKNRQARKIFEAALKRRPNSVEARIGLAMAARRQGDLKAAQEHLNAAHGQRPKDPGILFELGMLYLKQEDYRRAAPLLKQAVQAKEDFQPAREAWAVALMHSGELVQAEAIFRGVLQKDPDALFSQFYLGKLYFMRRNHAQARPLLMRFLDDAPKGRTFAARREDAQRMLKAIEQEKSPEPLPKHRKKPAPEKNTRPRRSNLPARKLKDRK